MRVVSVPLDGSEGALTVLPVARRLAELEGATMHLVHVASAVTPATAVLERVGLTDAELRGSVLDVKAGEPASHILEAARERHSVFIVMCTHSTAGQDTMIGHTALAVLKGAPCPVVLVRPERGAAPWTPHRILLAHDSTPTTSAAMAPAVDLARKAGAELVILHVAESGGSLPEESGSLPPSRYADQPQYEWPEWAGEFLDRVGCVCPLGALKSRLAFAQGVPGSEVLRLAAQLESDLVAMAWRGEWVGEHAATVKAALRGATCPVMILPAR